MRGSIPKRIRVPGITKTVSSKRLTSLMNGSSSPGGFVFPSGGNTSTSTKSIPLREPAFFGSLSILQENTRWPNGTTLAFHRLAFSGGGRISFAFQRSKQQYSSYPGISRSIWELVGNFFRNDKSLSIASGGRCPANPRLIVLIFSKSCAGIKSSSRRVPDLKMSMAG